MSTGQQSLHSSGEDVELPAAPPRPNPFPKTTIGGSNSHNNNNNLAANISIPRFSHVPIVGAAKE